MSVGSLKMLWRQPLIRAGLLHLALLGGGWLMARAIAGALGLSVSVLGLLLGYAVVNVALTGWLLRRREIAAIEPESDQTAEALVEFADQPLGALIGDAKARLARARKGVGRQAAMYQPLDRLVRLTRKIERRLALEPELRAGFTRSLSQDLPLIATTAEQYVRLSSEELSEAQNASLITAEGVLREAADRLDRLSESDGKIDAAHIGLIRMDAHAEVLAERMSADTDGAGKRAAAARVSHALRRAAKVVDAPLAGEAREVADRIDAMGADEAAVFLGLDSGGALSLIAAADGATQDPDAARQTVLSEKITALG